MRFRDLETGVFLTRDPIGYGDGPNVYCYVHCNPITRFDAWGLETKTISYHDTEAKGDETKNIADAKDFENAALRDKRMGDSHDALGVSSAGGLIDNLKEQKKAGVKVGKIVLYTHGSQASPKINSEKITDEQFAEIGGLLSPGENGEKPVIDLRGCDIAQGKEGTDYINKIADITQAKVIAGTGKQQFHQAPADGVDVESELNGRNYNEGTCQTATPLDSLTKDQVPSEKKDPIRNGGRLHGVPNKNKKRTFIRTKVSPEQNSLYKKGGRKE